MKVITLNEILFTERDVLGDGFRSRRFLLEKDGMGFTLTNTFIPKGTWHRWHYKHHLEACYCIEGLGLLQFRRDGATTVRQIEPHTLYALDNHDEHEFRALQDTTLICIFNPPLKGGEIHGPDGSYANGREADI